MTILKKCPNCGKEISDENNEFCTECGYDLYGDITNGFFDKLQEKTNYSIIIFSFIIFGVFLFIGSILWSTLIANRSIDLITYIVLTMVFSVFFGGIFVGYFGCKDKSYIISNFLMYLGSIFAVLSSGFGLIFTIFMGISSLMASAFSPMNSNSIYGSATQPTASTQLIDMSLVFKVILFILLIPVASYFGVYLGYFLKKFLKGN